MQRDAETDEVKGAGESLEPYLGKGGVQVALELVSLVKGILEPALCGYQSFLTLPKGLQQLLSLIQHVHHQLLKVGVRIGTVGGPQRVPLIDCGHHLTHGGNGENLLSVGSGVGWEGAHRVGTCTRTQGVCLGTGSARQVGSWVGASPMASVALALKGASGLQCPCGMEPGGLA